jgi:fibronectin-binding autotransporter adhesin
MPVINGVYLKDFTALPGAVADANIIPIAISGNQIAYRTTVSGIVTDARVTSKLLTGLSVTGGAISATDTILEAFGKVQNQINGKQDAITLTTVGTSGAATFIANTLNIPNYADGGVLSLSAIGASPNANAATITGTVLNLEPASASFGGVVTTGAQTIAGDKTLTGALVGTTGSFASSGGSDSFAINHSSGAGIALNITKGGNGEGIYVNKTSGSGNAATIIGTLNATTIVKSGGTSSEFLKADGSVDSTAYGTGSVTSVAALTLGTSGTDLSSTVANGTTTPVITLNVPDASATARGVVTTGTQTIAGAKTLTNDVLLTAAPASTRYITLTGTDTNTGILALQAGAGSPAFGGGLNLYSHSHATRAGWVTAGISSGSGGKFTVNSSGLGEGTDVFTVDASGNVVANGSLGLTGTRVVKGWFTDLESTNPIAGSVTGSAASLTTTRTIWGQNFNGSANVSGALTGVTGITTSGGYTQSGTSTNTFTGTSSVYTGQLSVSGGANVAAANSVVLTGGATPTIWGLGADNSTMGALTLQVAKANYGSNIEALKISTAGTVLLGGALTGTSATFSSTLTTGAPSGGTAKPFKIGNVATVTPTSQNRTIEIEIDGTTYYLTAKTTND